MNYEPLLDEAANYRDPDNSLITPNRMFSFSIVNAVVILSSSMIGCGTVTNSIHFKCGVLWMSLIHIVVTLITYYACWSILYTMKIHRKCTYEELWSSCGYKASWLISEGSCLSLLIFLTANCKTIQELWNWFVVDSLKTESDSILVDPYCIYGILTIILFIPFVVQRAKSFLYVCGWLKICMLLLFTSFCVYFCYIEQSSQNNTAKNSVLFNTSENWGSGITAITDTYTVYVVLFASLRGMVDLSYCRCVRVLKWSFGICFVSHELIWLLQYFTLYDNRTSVLFFPELTGNVWVIRSGALMFFFLIILSFPLYLHSARVSTLQVIYTADSVMDYPQLVWIDFGVVWLICCFLLSTITGNIIDIVEIFVHIISILLQFIIPALMLMRCMPSLHKAHWIGIVLLFLYGVGVSAYHLSTIRNVV